MGLEVIAIGILGSGGLGAVLVYLVQRRKAPAEVDSIIVTGAESAVLSLQRANEAAVARAVAAEEQLAASHAREARKDERIESLERQLDRIQAMLNAARDEVASLRRGDDTTPA